MPPFRDWPVCWLFLLATATVDAALLSGSAVSPWAAGWVVGQMMVLGLWVVHGEMHRLLRGAIFVAGLGGLSWLVATVIEPFFLQRWFALLAATLAIQGSVAAAAAATAWASRNRQRGAGVAIDEPWQYPLIEIFGWTIIVAAASVLLRYAAMEPLLKKTELAAFWLSGCLVVGVCGSLCYDCRRWPRGILLPAVLILPGIYWLVWSQRMLGGELNVMRAAQFYVVAYLVSRWLDADAAHTARITQRRSTQGEDSPVVKGQVARTDDT